jgi:glycerol-3-phosphate dehydrogenase
VSEQPDHVDLAVVGGGIHGVGVLQAAAAMGWSALLIEERAIASGTSSRSSKLIHGGLRYLEHGSLRLVRESLAERAILLGIAPSLVKLVPFYIPIYRATRRRPWQIRAGLSLYALLGDLGRDARFSAVPRAEWPALDGLEQRDLEAVFRYFDGQTDDAALARAVLRSAVSLGAKVALPAQFLGAAREGDGYRLRYRTPSGEVECRASALVNAAGPWVNRVREKIAPLPKGLDVDLVAGTHIEIEGAIARGIYYTEAPGDARAVFVMPWKGRTLIGTTELRYDGDPRDVRATPEEIAYLEATFRRYFPQRAVRRLDAWAGLRVLPRGTGSAFARPRETRLVCDDERAPRMVAIYGGKLTGYRATAEKVITRLARTLPSSARRADTRTLRIGDDGDAGEPGAERALELESKARAPLGQ